MDMVIDVTDIAKTTQAIRDAGVPDFLNRWIGMTPERLAEINANLNRRRTMISLKTNPKITAPGPKEQQQRDLAAAKRDAATTTPAPKKKPQNLHQALAAAQGRHLDATLLGPTLPATPPTPTQENLTVTTTAPKTTAPTAAKATAAKAPAKKTGTRGDAANQKARTKVTSKTAGAPKGSKLTATTAKTRREPDSARAGVKAPTAKAPDMKATTKPAKRSKSDIVHDMLTSVKGATREELSKASGWLYVNLKTAAERAGMVLQDNDGRFKLVPKPAKAS